MSHAGVLAGTAAAGTLVGATLIHVAPAVMSWRALRRRVVPALAGVGRPDHVALTFDDGPDPASTPAILDLLDRLDWRATFFLLGDQVRRSPQLAAEVAARGHEIGVHGDQHTSHLRRSARWTTRDVAAACDIIGDATSTTPRWFRPPYGALSASSLVAARRSQLQTVLWTSWGRDWRPEATASTVAEDVLATWKPGGTVLLHDSDVTSAPESWRATLGALPRLAERWAALGLAVGTLADHDIRSAPAIRCA